MKVRMFDDGSAQIIPEEGDGEHPIAPVLPPKSAGLLALEANEAEIARSGSVETKVRLAEGKALRVREEEQHAANLAAYEKNKPKVPASAGGRALTKSEIAELPWALSADAQEKQGIVEKGKAARAKVGG